jgi:hypothetical protein
VALEHQGDTVAVRIADPDPDDGPDEVRAALADDVDRLAALGGALDATASGDRLELRAWLPDRLRPVVLDAGAVA